MIYHTVKNPQDAIRVLEAIQNPLPFQDWPTQKKKMKIKIDSFTKQYRDSIKTEII